MKLFDNASSLNNDKCQIINKEIQNNKLSNYYFDQSKIINNISDANNMLLDNKCINIKDGTGWLNSKGTNIDKDSFFRNRDGLTNKKEIHQLNSRPLKTTPYRINEKHKNIKLENGLRCKLYYKKNDCINLTDYDFTKNIFDPILIQNPEYNNDRPIDCVNWTRCGEPSREKLKDKEYLKKIGYSFNGKFWHKN